MDRPIRIVDTFLSSDTKYKVKSCINRCSIRLDSTVVLECSLDGREVIGSNRNKVVNFLSVYKLHSATICRWNPTKGTFWGTGGIRNNRIRNKNPSYYSRLFDLDEQKIGDIN